jgi:hypothetical protein
MRACFAVRHVHDRFWISKGLIEEGLRHAGGVSLSNFFRSLCALLEIARSPAPFRNDGATGQH